MSDDLGGYGCLAAREWQPPERYRTRDLAMFNLGGDRLLDFRGHTAACSAQMEEHLALNEPSGPQLHLAGVEWVDQLPRHSGCPTVWRSASAAGDEGVAGE